MDEETRHIWQRLEGETDSAYEAFRCYRELPSGTRSLRKTWVEYNRRRGHAEPKPGAQPPKRFVQWRKTHDWDARAVAYDTFLEFRAIERNEMEHVAQLNAYRRRLLSYAEISSDCAIRGLRILQRSLAQMENEDEHVPVKNIYGFTVAVTKLFEAASGHASTALAVDALLEAVDRGQNLSPQVH